MNTTPSTLIATTKRTLYTHDAFGNTVAVPAGTTVTVTPVRKGWAVRTAPGMRTEAYTWDQLLARVEVP